MSNNARTEIPFTRERKGSDFTELSRRVKAAGLLERQPAYYAVRAGVLALVSAGLIATSVTLDASWWQLAVAAALAILSGQFALLAHDLAHRQIFRTQRPNQFCGLIVGNLLLGMSKPGLVARARR